jgi:Tol biopolymer transport system component
MKALFIGVAILILSVPAANYAATAEEGFGHCCPRWSPDGKKIVFVAHQNSHEEIYLMNSDGSNVQRLTHSKSADQPAWSPDGKRIVFSLKKGRNHWEIAVMRADGTDLKELTRHERGFLETLGWVGAGTVASTLKLPVESYGKEVDLETPAWSPDGKNLAFALGSTGGNHEIFLMDLENSKLRQLTRLEKDIGFPAWSPDGKKIAVVSLVDRRTFVMDADGSNVRQVTREDATNPAWSPDGKKIAVSLRIGFWQIYVMNADGSSLRQLTDTQSDNITPDWSPDGKAIVFASRRGGRAQAIYVMDADGSNVRQLTQPKEKL